MKQVQVGIIGLGTVGCGTFDVLRRNAGIIADRVGSPIAVKRIATRTPSKARPIEVPAELISDDVDALLADPEIHIVAELMGGIEPARGYILRALAAGKSVVTANKELIAKHGPELRAVADESGVDLLFEASVGGGIPLIKPLRESLAGNTVTEVMGILNGTTNYILTKMSQEGRDFGDVLKEAQDLGYAEADPTSDVDGWDTMYKLSIVAAIAFDTPVHLRDIFREGITKVSARDIEYAADLDYVIKLLALGRRHPNGEIELGVHPTLLPVRHPLANVNDAFNAVLVHGDAVGDVMFYGRGAGADPTGSAVVSDIIEAARNRIRNTRNLDHAPSSCATVRDFAAMETRFCVRMQVLDQPGAMAQIAQVFGDKGVSIESIVQKKSDGEVAEIFWMTHRTTQRAMARSLGEFNRVSVVQEVSTVLRVEGD